MSAPETQRTLLAPALLPIEDEALVAPAEVSAAEGPLADHVVEHLADQWPTPTGPVPPGAPLADLLAEGLIRRGWHVDYRWTTYDGHAFDARRVDNRYDVELKLLDGPHEEGRGLWHISAKRRTGFFTRWLPGRKDPAEHAMLRRHIDEALQADPRTASPSGANAPSASSEPDAAAGADKAGAWRA